MFKCRGFTLFELTVVMGIIAIIAYFAIPSFRQLMIAYEENYLKRILAIHIQKAKSDAQIYHKNVMLCPSNDLILCNNDWNKGFIGFIDSNQNQQRELDEPILYSNSLDPHYGSVNYRSFGQSSNYVVFQRENGLPFASNGSFTYCSTISTSHTKIVLSRMGHVRFEKITTC